MDKKPDDGEWRFQDIISDGGILATLEAFDIHRRAFFAELATAAENRERLTQEPTDLTIEFDPNSFKEPVRGFMHAVVINEEDDWDDKINLICDIVKNDCDERVKKMCECLGDEGAVPYFDENDLRSHIIKAFEAGGGDVTLTVNHLLDFYCNDLMEDTNRFIGLLLYIGPEDESGLVAHTSTFEITKNKRDHIIDVAKIAAGTGIALMFQHFLEKRRRS